MSNIVNGHHLNTEGHCVDCGASEGYHLVERTCLDHMKVKYDVAHSCMMHNSNLVTKLQAFKTFVHKRLDDAGVPADPYPKDNAAHGCRIGGRLDWLIAGMDDTKCADHD